MTDSLLEPHDAATTAAMLAEAAASGVTIVPRGSGTKLARRGLPSSTEIVLSTRRLSSPVEHFAGDLVATIPAGASLAEVNQVLTTNGQWLPLDPPHADRATIGGIVATNDSGPRRHKHGTVRDLIIGTEFALTNGRVAHAGGRVVKNVAGYDVSRLLCGSFGSLAVITSATFKLAPIAPASRTVIAQTRDVREMCELARALDAAPLSPSAIEFEAPHHRLLVRFETTAQAADRQASTARALLERGGATSEIVEGRDETEIWDAHETQIWDAADVVLKISVLPTNVPAILAKLHELAGIRSLGYTAGGRATLGVFLVGLRGDVAEIADTVTGLRQTTAENSGSVLVLVANRAFGGQLDAWGPVGNGLATMRTLKAQFDPTGTLNPGGGPGGI